MEKGLEVEPEALESGKGGTGNGGEFGYADFRS